MSVKPDKWIRRMALEHKMIEPFTDRQVREGVISYGVSSYGYDIRVADEFQIFTNVNSTIVDPKRFDPKSLVSVQGDMCIVPPNSFALARSVEYFRIPRNVLTICLGKSTYARWRSASSGRRSSISRGAKGTTSSCASAPWIAASRSTNMRSRRQKRGASSRKRPRKPFTEPSAFLSFRRCFGRTRARSSLPRRERSPR